MLVKCFCVVLMDELVVGFDIEESVVFGCCLCLFLSYGVSVLLVDYDMELVLGVCDCILVFDFGKVIGEGMFD